MLMVAYIEHPYSKFCHSSSIYFVNFYVKQRVGLVVRCLIVSEAVIWVQFLPDPPEGPYYNMCFLVHPLVLVNNRVASPPI